LTQLLTQPVTQTGHNQSTLNKLNETKQENNITPPSPPEKKARDTPLKKQTDPAVKRLIDYYFNRFTEKFGTKPVIEGGKDGAIFKKLLSFKTEDELRKLLDAFFESTDPFITNSSYTVGVFKSQINKLVTSQGRKQVMKLNLPILR